MVKDIHLYQKIVFGFSKLGQALKNKSWQGAFQKKISPTQGQILIYLASKRKEEGVCLSDISSYLGLTSATVSDAVRVLIEKKLINKKASSVDKRLTHHKLTARGLKLAQEAGQWPDFLNPALEILSQEDQEKLYLIMIKMIRQLQVREEISVSRMCVTCQYFQPNVYADHKLAHHCRFVNAAFGYKDLRLDCPDHQEADLQRMDKNWNEFINNEQGR